MQTVTGIPKEGCSYRSGDTPFKAGSLGPLSCIQTPSSHLHVNVAQSQVSSVDEVSRDVVNSRQVRDNSRPGSGTACSAEIAFPRKKTYLK